MMSRLIATLLCAVVFLVFSGCGEGGSAGAPVQVSVATTKIKLEDTDSIAIVFTPDGQGEAATAGGAVKDQPFKVIRSSKQGLPVGKYKVTVNIVPYGGLTPERNEPLKEFCKPFSDITNTNLRYEVTGDAPQSITIDLDAATVTKK